MADLQGPKIRVGKIEGGRTTLEPGAKLILDAGRTEPGTSACVGLDYKELPRDVRPGDTLLLNDGLLRLTVDAVRGEQVHTTVVVGGELSNNKGINKQGGGLTAPALTAKDMEDIKTAMSFQADYVAVMTMRSISRASLIIRFCSAGTAALPTSTARSPRATMMPSDAFRIASSAGIASLRSILAIINGLWRHCSPATLPS